MPLLGGVRLSSKIHQRFSIFILYRPLCTLDASPNPMTNDVKNFLYAWCGKRRLSRPVYSWSEERPTRPNGTRNLQTSLFRAELRMPSIAYIGKGEARAIKMAQTEAARDMCRHMLSAGLVSALEIAKVPNAGDLVHKEPQPSTSDSSVGVPSTDAGPDIICDTPVVAVRNGGDSSRKVSQVQTGADDGDLPSQKRPYSSDDDDTASSDGDAVVFYGRKRAKSNAHSDTSSNASLLLSPNAGDCSRTPHDSYVASSISSSKNTLVNNRDNKKEEGVPVVSTCSTSDAEKLEELSGVRDADPGALSFDQSCEDVREIVVQCATYHIDAKASLQKEQAEKPRLVEVRDGSSAEVSVDPSEVIVVEDRVVMHNTTLSPDTNREEDEDEVECIGEIMQQSCSSSKVEEQQQATWKSLSDSSSLKNGLTERRNRTILKRRIQEAEVLWKWENRTEERRRLSEDVWGHYRNNTQDETTFVWKMDIRQRLLQVFEGAFSECYLYAVGSTVNGLGSFNSDMDLCLLVPDARVGTSTERLYALDMLRRAKRVLHKNSQPLGARNILLIQAKVPILRLKLVSRDRQELEVDINCNSVCGIRNSHLLHYYARVDERFPALSLIIKHWAIRAGINDAQSGTLNSYSLILLVLHYLQCGCVPPVLPNLQALFPEKFSTNQELGALTLFDEMPTPANENAETVGDLLAGFFAYFHAFDFQRQAISIRRASKIPKSHFREAHGALLFIEEPFDGKNTARTVTKPDKMKAIEDAFKYAHSALREHANVASLGVQL